MDEAPRSKGRFNLDRAAQEHMNEGLEVWIPPESTSSLRGMEAQVIRPLMDVALPGYTPSSTPGSSQVSGGSSRLKELHERLQLRNRESPARADLPSTWGGATCQECGDLELQEEYGREISQAQSDRLERGAEGEERLLPRRDLGGILHVSAST